MAFLRVTKRKKRSYIKQFYKLNQETGRYIIEVSLDNYNEVFNGWDPSPIKRRDLDPEVKDFILNCSDDLPLNFEIELKFYVPKSQLDKEKEALTIDGVKNNFNFFILLARKELMNNRKKTIKYITLSILFLLLSYFSDKAIFFGLFSTILKEGLFVGGWVFMWEAFSIIFFSDSEMYSDIKHYNRLLDSPIIFEYQ